MTWRVVLIWFFCAATVMAQETETPTPSVTPTSTVTPTQTTTPTPTPSKTPKPAYNRFSGWLLQPPLTPGTILRIDQNGNTGTFAAGPGRVCQTTGSVPAMTIALVNLPIANGVCDLMRSTPVSTPTTADLMYQGVVGGDGATITVTAVFNADAVNARIGQVCCVVTP